MFQPARFVSTLRTKIALLSFGFAFIACAAVFWLSQQNAINAQKQRADEAIALETETIALRLEENFRKLIEDVRLVSLTPPIQGIARTRELDSPDPVDGSSYEQWQRRLATIMESLMKIRPEYFQLRYLAAEDGRELVRVNRLGGQIQIVAEENLQDKSGEPYMQSLSSLRPGMIYFSDVSLNREHGEIDPTEMVTLRTMIPVYKSTGEIFGVIVINADYEALIVNALQMQKPAFSTLIYNSEGHVLSYDAATTKSEFYFGEQADPKLADLIQQAREGAKGEVKDLNREMLYDAPLGVLQQAQGLDLDVLTYKPVGSAVQPWSDLFSQNTTIVLGVVFAGLIIVLFLADRLTEPLRQMTERIRIYSQLQRYDALELPVGNSGELGELARTFTSMLDQLHESRSLTEDIIRYAVDGMMVIDSDGNIVTFNPACEVIFGYQASEVIGQNVSVFMDQKHVSKHSQFVDGFQIDGIKSAVGKGREILARRKDGTEFPIEISLSAIKQRGSTFFCAVIRDVTAQKAQRDEVAQQKETLEFALEGGEIGFWTWDLKTGEVDFCKRSAGFIGLARSDMPNNHSVWNSRVHSEDAIECRLQMKRFLEGETTRYNEEFRIRHTDGHWVWIKSQAIISKRDEAGKPERIVGIQLDITNKKQSEIAMNERNRQLELAETVADMGHWSLDIETGETFWSEGIYRIHGVTPETHDTNLESGIKFYHPDDRPIVEQKVKQAIESGKPFSFQLRLIRADGELRHVVSRGEPIKSEKDGKTISVFGIFQDVTEQVNAKLQLNWSEEKNRTLLESIVDGVMTIDEHGVVDGCNPACASIFGYSVDELTGKPLAELVPEETRSTRAEEFVAMLDGRGDDRFGRLIEIPGLRKNGEVFTVEFAVNAIQIGQQRFFTAVLRDITSRKQVERMKNEFVSTVNHELRTPLTAIYGSLDLLKTFNGDQLDQDGQELLSMAHDGCGRLSALVNDILDLEKIAAGKMEYRMAKEGLNVLVDDIVHRHRQLEKQFGITFEIEKDVDDVDVWLDPSRFNQALVNLMSNAAKFSPKGEIVTIRTFEAEDGGVCVSVQDRGPGIPENFRKRIFEKFAQADGSASKSVPGTGLGLNITRSIIEAFGGSVSFETEENVGTVFIFKLPKMESIEQLAS